jgi:tRNA(Ile2) C34 agmatinyltransferase TiaS
VKCPLCKSQLIAQGKGYYCPKCGYWSTILKKELNEMKIIKKGRITITNSKGRVLLYRDPLSPKEDELLSSLNWEIYIRIER